MDATRGLDTSYDWETIHLLTPRGRWHIAMQNRQTGVITTPEGCNLDQSVTQAFPDLPEEVAASDLCHRCHKGIAE